MSEETISEPRLVSLFGKYIIGWEIRTTNEDEENPDKAKIPGLWKRVFKEELYKQVPDQKDQGILMGAYTRFQSDANGPYSLIVGVEVGDIDTVPPGMVGITVLAQEYLIFTSKGESPQMVIDGWGAVWKYFSQSTTLTRAFTTDFERYDLSKPGTVDIHIAVR